MLLSDKHGMMNDAATRERIKKITEEKLPETNIMVAQVLLIFAVLCVGALFAFVFGLLRADSLFVNVTLIGFPVLFVIFGVWCLAKKGKGKAFKYIFFALLTIFWLFLELMSGGKCKMLLPVLLLLSLRYYNRKFTMFTYIVAVVMLLLSVIGSAWLYPVTGLLDLNTVTLPAGQTIAAAGYLGDAVISLQLDPVELFLNGLRLTFMPNFLFLTLNTFIALQFMTYNLSNMLRMEMLAKQEADLQLELKDTRTRVMLSQIKPHFIFNTLTAIAALCTRDGAKARKLTLDFSVYLRNNLSSIDPAAPKVCPFETELEHIKTYLSIEKIRFGDKLYVEYDIRETDFTVPVMSIQPIVENAVKHGIFQKSEGGMVTIATEKTDGGYLVIVADDGVGFDRDKIGDDGREHVGIANIEKRIALYGGHVDIDSTPGEGTTVTAFIKDTEEQL